MKDLLNSIIFYIISIKNGALRVFNSKLKNKRLGLGGKNISSDKNENLVKILLYKNLFIIVISAILFFFVGYFVYKFFQIEYFHLFRGDNWDVNVGEYELNNHYSLIFFYDNSFQVTSFNLFSINLKDNSTKILSIDPLSKSSRGYNIQSTLLNSGLSDGKVKTLVSEVENLIGWRVDSYVAIDELKIKKYLESNNINDYRVLLKDTYSREYSEDDLIEFQNIFITLLDRGLSLGNIITYVFNYNKEDSFFETSLDKSDLINLLWRYKQIEHKPLTSIIGPQMSVKEEGKLRYYSQIDIDRKVAKLLSDIDIIAEQAEIEVYNATNISGLANIFKRKIENAGSTVIKTGNFIRKSKSNYLYITEGSYSDYSKTIDFINSIYSGRVIIRDSSEYNQNFSGNLVFIIGN